MPNDVKPDAVDAGLIASAPPVKHVVAPDPVTGDLIARPVEEVAAEQRNMGRRALFDFSDDTDEDDPALPWTTWVTLEGSPTKFYVRELNDKQMAANERRNKEDLAEHLGIPAHYTTDDVAFAEQIRKAPDGMRKWLEWQKETALQICQRHVKDWDEPGVPFNPAYIGRLTSTARAELAAAILQKSTIGRSNGDFLGRS